MGSILGLFRLSGPLCFRVQQGAFSASGGRAAAATGAAGGFYVSLYKQWYQNWSKTNIFLGLQKGRLALFGFDLALFRPAEPLCFPVRQGAFAVSGRRVAAATGVAGGFYVSL